MSKLNFLKTSPWVKNVAMLASGTAIAQAIPAAVSPILTRLYSPEDFGLMAIFLAVTYAMLPAVSGKYDIAMVTAKDQKEADLLYDLALWLIVVLSCCFFLLLLFRAEEILNLLDKRNLGNWIFAVPCLLCLLGIFNTVSYVANRQKKYTLLSKFKIIKSVFAAIITIVLGWLGSGFSGLLAGYLFGTLIANIAGMRSLKIDISLLRLLSFSKEKKNIAIKYKDFPLFNATAGVLNGFQERIPFFFIAPYFADNILGYYMLMFQVAAAPLYFISFSISQVNLKKVAELVYNEQNITRYLYKLTGVLLGIVLIPTLILVSYAPEIFEIVFGKQWIDAGKYLKILMPAFALQFIVSTLSSTMDATQYNKLGALWKVTSFISTLAVFAVIAPLRNFELLLYANLINNLLVYSLYYLMIIYAASHLRKHG